jgi:hypothetical protein
MTTGPSDNAPPHSGSPPGPPACESLDLHLKRGAESLRDALRDVIAGVPARKTRPQEFARTLKIHRNITGRLLKAVEHSDPLAALCEMPRAEGLRTILKAAKSCVPKEAVERANRAVQDLEQLLDHEIGGWEVLHSVASDWLPDTRKKFEMSHKRAVYKGMANLRGCCADTEFCAFLGYPDETGERVDAALIAGTMGLRRLRPSAEICFTSIGASADGPQPITIEGVSLAAATHEYPLLEQFCSSPLPRFRVVRSEDRAHYLLKGNAVGPGSAVDMATACTMKSRHPRYQTDPPRRIAAFGDPTVPCKSLIIDMLLHEDVWPDATPELIMYDTTRYEVANPNSLADHVYRLNVTETIEYLGKGAARFRVAEVGQYVEMIQHVCERLGWDSERLRGYRCHIRYPIVGASACIVFDPPPAPPSSGNAAATSFRPS